MALLYLEEKKSFCYVYSKYTQKVQMWLRLMIKQIEIVMEWSGNKGKLKLSQSVVVHTHSSLSFIFHLFLLLLLLLFFSSAWCNVLWNKPNIGSGFMQWEYFALFRLKSSHVTLKQLWRSPCFCHTIASTSKYSWRFQDIHLNNYYYYDSGYIILPSRLEC